MEWARMLAYITGTVDQELLLRNEYLVDHQSLISKALRAQITKRDLFPAVAQRIA